MHISQLNKQLQSITEHHLSFRPGQIIKGKILKIFPDQNAEIFIRKSANGYET